MLVVMMWAIRILFVLLFLAAAALGTRHGIHMFQLNSYQYQGEGRFLRTHLPETLGAPVLGILVAAATLFINNQLLALILDILYFALLCFVYRPRPAKKKLVVTARVKRLIATTAAVYILLGGFLLLAAGSFWRMLIFLGAAAAALCQYVVLLANLINIPVEKGVKRYYINDARRMLKACPDLKIIGITGSYGKTSVKYYLHALLSEGFDVLMTPESYNTPMGVVMTIRGSLKATHRIFLCEMGARHVGDIKEICDIVDPRIGVITSLGYQHLETFHSLDNIVGTKKELFDALPAGAPRFVNGDNEFVKQYGLNEGAITYGLEEGNAYRACDLEYSEKGSKFKVQAPDGSSAEFSTGLLGEHNVVNITGAIAVAHELGIALEKLRIPVRRLQGAPHRLQPLAKNPMLTVIDDAYNSNPNGANMAIRTLGMFNGLRILVTPGMVELGAEQDHANYQFGVDAVKYCDYIVLVGHKTTESIKRGAESAGLAPEKLYVAENLQDAMDYVYGIPTDKKKIVLLENDLPDNYA